jgi:DNA-binding beta-propeller fold protein YncE
MKTLDLNFLRPACLLACVVFGLSACVTVQTRNIEETGRASRSLVFPAPPDDPRFVFERSIRGNLDIVPEKETNALKRAITGVSDENSERLSKPYAVAVSKGRIYVSDSVARNVMVFDVPASRFYTIGENPGPGRIGKPLGIDVDAAGNVYVADAAQKKVLVFDDKGKHLRSIGKQGDFDRLSSVSVDRNGERIYVTDIGGINSERHRVAVYNARTGQHLFDIGKRGTEPGEFNLPRDVALGKDGRIYVVDGGNFRIQIFDKDGKFLKNFGSVGKNIGQFARPKEIAADSQGNVYVVDAAFGNFQIFTPEGELLMFIGDRSERDVPAGYMLPSGIALDEDDRIYFVDQWFARVDVFRPYSLKSTEGYLGRRNPAVGVAK